MRAYLQMREKVTKPTMAKSGPPARTATSIPNGPPLTEKKMRPTSSALPILGPSLP